MVNPLVSWRSMIIAFWKESVHPPVHVISNKITSARGRRRAGGMGTSGGLRTHIREGMEVDRSLITRPGRMQVGESYEIYVFHYSNQHGM